MVFLGTSSKIIEWLNLQRKNNLFYPVIHPDFRNRNKEKTRYRWNRYYLEPYGVNDFINKLINN